MISYPFENRQKKILARWIYYVIYLEKYFLYLQVLVGISDLTIESNNMSTGIILALVSAFFYAAYIVFLKRKVDHEDRMDIPMFFGFVGIFNLTLLWPLFFILHYGHWEEFEWPNSHQWTFLIINGLIGTVLSEVLWLW